MSGQELHINTNSTVQSSTMNGYEPLINLLYSLRCYDWHLVHKRHIMCASSYASRQVRLIICAPIGEPQFQYISFIRSAFSKTRHAHLIKCAPFDATC